MYMFTKTSDRIILLITDKQDELSFSPFFSRGEVASKREFEDFSSVRNDCTHV